MLFRSLCVVELFSDHFPLRNVCLHCELVSLSAWRMLLLSGAYSSQQNMNWSYFIQAEIQAGRLGNWIERGTMCDSNGLKGDVSFFSESKPQFKQEGKSDPTHLNLKCILCMITTGEKMSSTKVQSFIMSNSCYDSVRYTIYWGSVVVVCIYLMWPYLSG